MKYSAHFSKLPLSIQRIIEKLVLEANPQSILLFGSRARGTARENSDFDLCVKSKDCSEAKWNKLLIEIDESPISLHKIDLVEFEKLSKEYQDAIQKDGLTLYESFD